jgi:hypothetical protein
MQRGAQLGHDAPSIDASAPLAVKPFLAPREAFRKQRPPSLSFRQIAGASLVTFLNAIYREVLKAAVFGMVTT